MITVLVLGGAECFWRAHGFTPAVQDTAGLWDMFRAQVTRAGDHTIVFLGSSRTMLGVDPGAISRTLPAAAVYQLGIDGSSPLPVLRDLAADSGFRGTVVCEVAPTMFFDPSRQAEAKSTEWVRHYHQRSRVSDVETRLRLTAQRHLTVLRPELNPLFMLKDLAGGHLPSPGYTVMDAKRFRFANFDATDTEGLRRRWAERFSAMGRTPSAAEVGELCSTVAASVQAIQSRGGNVVFVRMPSTGAVAQIEEARFPRRSSWDVLAQTPGIVAIHCDDEPALGGFECPDDSHLGGTQAGRFSIGLAAVVLREIPALASAPAPELLPGAAAADRVSLSGQAMDPVAR